MTSDIVCSYFSFPICLMYFKINLKIICFFSNTFFFNPNIKEIKTFEI